MREDQHSSLREKLGSLALGHLDRRESAALRAHLAGCPDCLAELAEVEPLAERIRAADWQHVTSAATPDPALRERIASSVAREQRQRAARGRARRWAAAVAAAAAVVAVGGVGAAIGRGSAPDAAVASKGPFETVEVVPTVAGIEASAGVVPHTWGVEIKLRAEGFEPGAAYAVYVTTADGRRRTAGAFVGTGTRTMSCNLNSDVLRADASSFLVVDDDGRTVLSAALPPVAATA